MLENEWLQIGYEKGIITDLPVEKHVNFEAAYQGWFKAKINRIKKQSVDRIECTYNKYYMYSEFIKLPLHTINEVCIYQFLNSILLKYGNITKKEFERIYQIVNNVMKYANECDIGFAKSLNWDIVKRYLAVENIKSSAKAEHSVSISDRRTLLNNVIKNYIYPEKQSACLCICLNFYLGLRLGELASLKWSDVNFTERKIYIHSTQVKAYERNQEGERGHIVYFNQDTTKTVYSVRDVPLVNEAVYILSLLKEHHKKKNYDSEYLAYDGKDTILSKSIERCLRRLCNLCCITPFNSHLIRKTFATELHNNGVPTKIITDLMGHSEMRTTERFYILSSGNDISYLRNIMQDALRMEL